MMELWSRYILADTPAPLGAATGLHPCTQRRLLGAAGKRLKNGVKKSNISK